MNYVTELQSVFKTNDVSFVERIRIGEAHFEIESRDIPAFDSITTLIESIPDRDAITIALTDCNDETYRFTSGEEPDNLKYTRFCSDAGFSDIVTVYIEITKNVKDGHFSVYCFKSFASDINALSNELIMSSFAQLLKGTQQLFFEVFDQECMFKTTTITFSSNVNGVILQSYNRDMHLQNCRDSSHFLNFAAYPLLPEDFHIEVDFANNPLSEVFERLTTILSLVYISTSAYLDDDKLNLQIAGHRNMDFAYPIEGIGNNYELYKIYHWIYTDGNVIDKALLARNILSLHCKYSEIKDVDGRTLASIQSNYNLYLRDNVEKYIDLKNNLAGYIKDVISQTGDYSTKLLDKFKSNLIAVLGFLFTVVLANIVSDRPLDNIFTRDITVIFEMVLLGSAVYLATSVFEINYQKKKAAESYNLLKTTYDTILSKEDINEVFNNDYLLKDMLKSINRGLIWYSIMWVGFLILAVIAIESVSISPTFLGKSGKSSILYFLFGFLVKYFICG